VIVKLASGSKRQIIVATLPVVDGVVGARLLRRAAARVLDMGAPQGHRRNAPIKNMGAEIQISAVIPRDTWLALEAEARRANCSKTKIIVRAITLELERLAKESVDGARSEAS
jgi:hypothetical protein